MSQPEIMKPTALEMTPRAPTTETPPRTSGSSSTTSSRTTILKEEQDSNDVYHEKAHINEDISLNIKNISEGDVRWYQQICDKILFEVNLLASQSHSTNKDIDEKKRSCNSDDFLMKNDVKALDGEGINIKKEEDNCVEPENISGTSMDVDIKKTCDTSSHSACDEREKDIKRSPSRDQFRDMYLKYVIQAGLNTHDSTIESIIKGNKNISTKKEQQISLLLFENNMTKHEKISLAFQILAISADEKNYQKLSEKNTDDDSPNACKRQKRSHDDFFSDPPITSTAMETELKDIQEPDEERYNRKREKIINSNISLNEAAIRRLLKSILISLTSIIKQSNVSIVNDDVPEKVTQLIQSLIAFKRNISNDNNGGNDYHETVYSLELFRKWYESDHGICPIINLLEYDTWKSCEEHPEIATKQEPTEKTNKLTDSQQNDRKQQEDAQVKMEVRSQQEPMKEEDEDMLVVLSPASSFPPIVNTVTDETNLNNMTNGNKSSPLQNSSQHRVEPQEPQTNQQSIKSSLTPPSKTQAATTPLNKLTSASPSSRAVVSFDITSNASSQNANKSTSPPFNILITEENLQQLEKFVEYSNLIHKPPTFITEKLFQYSTPNKASGNSGDEGIKLESDRYNSFIDDVFSSCTDNSSHHYKEFFRILLECFDYHSLGFVNCIEVGIGFSFLCAGNKSSKLAMAYELLDTYKIGYLTSKSLHVYFRSFLNMLVGISLLTKTQHQQSNPSNKKIVYQALNYGATWTQEHLLSSLKKQPQHQQENDVKIKFEDFAEWYTEGGYTVAPWLELLDLGKFLSLLHSNNSSSSCRKEDDRDRREQQQQVPNDSYSPEVKHNPIGSNNRYGNDGNLFHVSSSHSVKDSNAKPSSNNYHPYPQQQQQHHPHPHHHQQHANQQPSSFFPPSPTNSAHSSIQSRSYNTYNQHQPHSYPPLPQAPLPPPGNHGPRLNNPSNPSHPQNPDSEVLFTFPLANDQSLIVQKEDALYVKTVVSQLGLLVLEPEEVWNIIYHHIPATAASSSHSHHFKCMKIDQRQFVHAMEMVLVRCYQINPSLKSSSKRIDPDSIFTLTNFYQSYDLEQMNSVPLNQLMGGLTLLCGGRKSVKLNFAFCLFSSSATTAEKILNGDELYYFLRSYLIILFSCCAQSLHLSADCVSKYIQDTSYKVCDDVMRHQWYHKRIRFVTFDDFGDWYNEGGYDVAPWLELLDLKKWVFMDEDKPQPPGVSISSSGSSSSRDHLHHNHQSSYYPSARTNLPPPIEGKPPHHAHLPPSISQSHSMTMEDDIMDFNSTVASNNNYPYRNSRYGHQQPPTRPPPVAAASSYDNNMIDDSNQPHDYYNYSHPLPHHQQHHPEDDRNQSHIDSRRSSSNRYHSSGNTPPPPHHSSSTLYHHQPQPEANAKQPSSSQLSFQLHTNDDFHGYLITISQQRVSFLKRLILESGLSNLDVNFVCNRILEYAKSNGKENDTNITNLNSASGKPNQMLFLSKDRFDLVMKSLLSMGKQDSNMSLDDERNLSDLLTSVFYAFDRNKSKVVDALELTCGLSILCGGRKSDKLEYAFDLLSENQEHAMTNTSGNMNCLTRRNMFRYLRSFSTVLMSITLNDKGSINILESSSETITALKPTKKKVSLDQVIDSGSAWATDQVFINSNTTKVPSSSRQKGGNTIINFDDFADWYTKGGYSHIPWLELLDLRKWMFT